MSMDATTASRFSLTLRLDETLHGRLVASAQASRRSLNSELVHLIEHGLGRDETAAQLPALMAAIARLDSRLDAVERRQIGD
jgi:hypothetical protein